MAVVQNFFYVEFIVAVNSAEQTGSGCGWFGAKQYVGVKVNAEQTVIAFDQGRHAKR